MAINPTPSDHPGYRYVDVVEGGVRWRYTHRKEPIPNTQHFHYLLDRRKTDKQAPRYAVTYEDIVDPDDRKYWVAGSVVRVLDLTTNEALAEFKHYVFDRGQGSTAGARSPWLSTHACPRLSGDSGIQTRFFVDQVS